MGIALDLSIAFGSFVAGVAGSQLTGRWRVSRRIRRSLRRQLHEMRLAGPEPLADLPPTLAALAQPSRDFLAANKALLVKTLSRRREGRTE